MWNLSFISILQKTNKQNFEIAHFITQVSSSLDFELDFMFDS